MHENQIDIEILATSKIATLMISHSFIRDMQLSVEVLCQSYQVPLLGNVYHQLD